MKFYYSSATCSTACHIALEESGLNYTPVEVSWERKLNVEELDRLNPLGAVPVLVSEQGKALTQNTAILEYIADLSPKSGLLPAPGTWERAETMSWVAFVAADLQKSFGPLFQAESMTESKTAQAEIEKFALGKIHDLLKHIDQNLAGKDFIVGNQFTIADAYLFVVTGWCKWVDISIDQYRNLSSYRGRIYERPAVQKVLKIEDLLD